MASEDDPVRAGHNLAVISPPKPDLPGLIARTAEGDAEALAALYDATAAHVHGLALRILADPGAAEEVTVDTYLQVWHQATRYDPARGGPLTWLLMVGRSRAIDRLRAARGERAGAERLGAALELTAEGSDPEEDAAVGERRRIVNDALARLVPEQRRLIELAYFGGLSHREIAAALGQPLGTVKTRIRAGMTRLRENLASVGGAP